MLPFILFVLLICLCPVTSINAGAAASAQCLAKILREKAPTYQNIYTNAHLLGLAAIRHSPKRRRADVISDIIKNNRAGWATRGHLEPSIEAMCDLLKNDINRFDR